MVYSMGFHWRGIIAKGMFESRYIFRGIGHFFVQITVYFRDDMITYCGNS